MRTQKRKIKDTNYINIYMKNKKLKIKKSKNLIKSLIIWIDLNKQFMKKKLIYQKSN